MKRIITLLFVTFIYQTVFAQNEGRIGIFTSISNTSLLNKDDKKQGDYLPTFKPGVGVSAGYHFTLFKAIPLGISAIASYNQSGQNYNGKYEDSSSFYAYSRLNYFRIGASLQFGTNIRRQVSLAATIGANYGFLTNYKERYELIEYNNDRYILDINDLNVSMRDTVLVVGELAEPIYNKTDLNIFWNTRFRFFTERKSCLWVWRAYGYGYKFS
ncbi:MAG: hypothetical protein UZ11_BCD004000481 [Bacteroidetes bacterium OLB11]|nr:MAG: hypothetical protein UZ11_BCD004000481 [Bacteroidetes bacterium OLB11]